MAKNRKQRGKRETRKSRIRTVAKRVPGKVPSYAYEDRRKPIRDAFRELKRSATAAELYGMLKTSRTGLFGTKRRVNATLRYDARQPDAMFEHETHDTYRLRKPSRNGAGKGHDAVRGRKKGLKRALGRSYVPADEKATREKREPFAAEMDPDVIDRGRRGHKRTQNLLADLVREHDLEPLSPSGEPQFDVAWRDDDRVYVAEVKSLTKRNEEKQLRLGLGQVFRYRQIMREQSATARAVLALERKPSDKGWQRLCRELDVILWWPGVRLPTASRQRS